MLTPHILLLVMPLYSPISSIFSPPRGMPCGNPTFLHLCFLNFCNATKWLVPSYKRSSFPHSYLRAWSQKVLLDTKLILSHQWWLLHIASQISQVCHPSSPYIPLSLQAGHSSLLPQSCSLVPAFVSFSSFTVTHLYNSFPWGTGWLCIAPGPVHEPHTAQYRQQSKKFSCQTPECTVGTPLQHKPHFWRDICFPRGSVNLNILIRTISLTPAYCSERGSRNALGIQFLPLLKKDTCKVILFVLIDHWLSRVTFQSKIFCSRTLC